jgi:ribose transport system substrate-binding protein
MAGVSKQLIASGVQGSINGAGFDCNAENIGLIRDGKVQVVCIADPRDWEAWAATDNLNRLIQGQPAVDQKIPVRLFDKDNVKDFTETDSAQGWQGGFDYKGEYKKLWGK